MPLLTQTACQHHAQEAKEIIERQLPKGSGSYPDEAQPSRNDAGHHL